jgi:glycosyltransferase involved in cell wall biosynthesis
MAVSVVIPAYNEQDTIGEVVNVLSDMLEIEEIIVVSDGSTDLTAEIAGKNGAKVIELKENVGKGGAMKVGIDNCNNDIIMFLDADLIGLTQAHVRKLLQPVISGNVDMSIGLFDGGRFGTDLAQRVTPFLTGQRVVKKSILENLCNMELSKFGIEAALTSYIRKNEIDYEKVILENMTHVTKEEKLGWKNGVKARMKMYWEIIKGLTLVK